MAAYFVLVLSFFVFSLPPDCSAAGSRAKAVRKKAAPKPSPPKIAPEPPKKTELQSLKELAEKGDAAAQYKLGSMFQEGVKIGKNAMEAARWFKKSAEAGNPKAQIMMARLTLTGEGTAKSVKEAKEWLERAANRGDAEARDMLEKTQWPLERLIETLAKYVPAEKLEILHHPLIVEHWKKFLAGAPLAVLFLLLITGWIIHRPASRAFVFAIFFTPVYTPPKIETTFKVIPFLWSCRLMAQNFSMNLLYYSAGAFLAVWALAFACLWRRNRKANVKIITQIPP